MARLLEHRSLLCWGKLRRIQRQPVRAEHPRSAFSREHSAVPP
jgi:hypothetical protein